MSSPVRDRARVDALPHGPRVQHGALPSPHGGELDQLAVGVRMQRQRRQRTLVPEGVRTRAPWGSSTSRAGM